MIPVSQTLNRAISHYNQGNFSLWFYKFLDLDETNNFKLRGKENGAAYNIIKRKYEELGQTRQTEDMLQTRHLGQMAFLETFRKKYEPLIFRARLKTRLISGMGYSHPTETGITLDHNLGVPYLPAASIKGLVRAARRLELGYMDEKHDADPHSLIPQLFGDQKTMGRVIFLDAYPIKPPTMEVEILTPHYGAYYNGNSEWPGDWMDLVLIKFLSVAAGTEYVFRALVDMDASDSEKETIKEVYYKSLCVLGVGGKTAVGYGRFEILGREEHPDMVNAFAEYLENSLTPEERIGKKVDEFLVNIRNAKDYNTINNLFDAWQVDKDISGNVEIAGEFKNRVRKKKNNGEWTSYYKKLSVILGFELSDDIETGETDIKDEVSGSSVDPKIEKAGKKMQKYIEKGKIDKKDLKKLKEYKRHFPDLYQQLEKMVRK